MKKNFFNLPILSYLICGLLSMIALAGCNDSESDNPGGNNAKSIKLQKLELEGAKYLSLTGNNMRAADNGEVGLFKIDESGNMTTVVVSCTEEENGTVTRMRTDIKVTPRFMFSLSGIYTFMEDCSFTDGKGNSIHMQQYYEPEAFYFNILVRNSDGAIFYIPESLSDTYFLSVNSYNFGNTATDSKGNLYLASHDNNNLGMVTTMNGELVLKQINPNGVIFPVSEITPFENGTVMVREHNGLSGSSWCYLFYPNGGYEFYDWESDDIISITNLASGAKAVRVSEGVTVGNTTEYIVSLHDFYVGTSYGEHSYSAPLASISSGTDYPTDYSDPDYWQHWIRGDIRGVYETENKYIIGTSLIVNKNTMEIRPLEGTETYIIFPNAKNTYKGLAWRAGYWGAEWYDIETMQYGTVDFNLPSDFQINNDTADIPSGKVIITGIRYTDGKSVTYFVDIETGNYICTETESERPITALIPLS